MIEGERFHAQAARRDERPQVNADGHRLCGDEGILAERGVVRDRDVLSRDAAREQGELQVADGDFSAGRFAEHPLERRPKLIRVEEEGEADRDHHENAQHDHGGERDLLQYHHYGATSVVPQRILAQIGSARSGRACLIYTFTPFVIYHGVMALNIKNAEVERLAAEVARLTGESKTEAIRRALDERRRRLKGASVERRRTRVLRLLESRIWPTLPPDQRGRRLTRAEEDEILGYGPGGV